VGLGLQVEVEINRDRLRGQRVLDVGVAGSRVAAITADNGSLKALTGKTPVLCPHRLLQGYKEGLLEILK